MLSATFKRQAREQAMQAQAIRVAVWGEAEAFGEFVAHMAGDARQVVVDDSARDAALAAFGLEAV